MKIGVIAHLKHPIGEPFAGGLEMHTHQLARGLRTRGHDVTVFASTRSDATLGVEPICDETSLSALGLEEATDVAFFREHHAYLKLMRSLKGRGFDVIHNNSLHYLPVAMSADVGAPVVTTLHTPPFCWLESGVRLCSEPDAQFVAVSEKMRLLWSRVRPIDQVILNGIDLDRFQFRPEPDVEPYLVWCGRVVPEKGLHHAIAAARAAGLQLRFAGPIWDQGYFAERIAPELDDGAVYIGHLGHRELAELVGGARASLCTPCWEEPYGLVVAEALACGTPVATFERGALAEILDESCGVLARPDEPGSLAAAAKIAIGLDRSACRRRAEAICDADVMINAYEQLYARLAS